MKRPTTALQEESIVIYGGECSHSRSAVAPPIYQTSTFAFDDVETFEKTSTAPLTDAFYTRYGNPTLAHAASIIADLEHGGAAGVFASGMGAATTVALAFLQAGDHVISQRSLYTGSVGLFKEILAKFGVTATFVDQTDAEAFEAAIQPNTRMIWVETPSNPLLHLTDLEAVSAVARRHGLLTICDNTVATPIGQNPLDYGFDLVLHSATKALAGHADILAGAVAGTRALIERLWNASIVVGATLGPFESWLLLRGMRTLPIRAKRQEANALRVAEFLEAHPRMATVNYPGLASHPQHALAQRQMRNYGCLMSFEIDGSEAQVDRFLSSLQLVRLAVSLGGYDSLIAKIGGVWAVHDAPAGAKPLSKTLLRLSVGIEGCDDLIEDLHSALRGL